MITIEPDNVWTLCRYDNAGASPLKNILDRGLKVEVPGAEYLYSFKSGAWDGKARLWEDYIDPTTKQHAGVQIRSGLVPRLISLLNLGGVTWQVGLDSRALTRSASLTTTQVKLRDYQFEAVKAAFGNQNEFGWWPRGVLALATGAGKTEIAVAMYEMNRVPTVFLVHRKDLLIQAKERFEQYGHTVGVIGDGKFEPHKGITVATMQTFHRILQAHGDGALEASAADLDRLNKLSSYMSSTKQTFFDECHLMASNMDRGNQFVKVSDFIDVPYRWGLTATPFMRTQYDNMLLEAVTGQALYRISSKELIDLGYLTPPRVVMKRVKGTIAVTLDWKGSRSSKSRAEYWRKVEEKGIKFNEIRTNMIVDEVAKGPYPMLILVKTIEQAHFIKDAHKRIVGHDILFLSGRDSAKDRRAAIGQLRDGSVQAVIATTIFDEGVDVPELRKVILASGGKSQVKTIQRVGRALRKAGGKSVAEIVDFYDAHHTMLEKHSKAREAVYREQEFEVIHG
jgi:superfamily II DNA or RNA helicase